MPRFIIHFIINNIIISGIIGIFIFAKKLLRNHITSRVQYCLWFFIFVLLFIPFIPLPFVNLTDIMNFFHDSSISETAVMNEKNITLANTEIVFNLLNDFTTSVSRRTNFQLEYSLFTIWVAGILTMITIAINSFIKLSKIRKSALPLQNKKATILFHNCLAETNIDHKICIYSTAHLKCPVIVGLFKPCIYLPIHLLSDYNEQELRHMILHELNHYIHRDAISNYLANIIGIIYWFNPFVWMAIKEMRIDREIACDSSVLNLIGKDSYEAYGTTLINFAEKISLNPFPFTSGISGTMAQMKKRVINIKTYKKPSKKKKLISSISFLLIGILILSFSPILSINAASNESYVWENNNVQYVDFTDAFEGYDGSFVLYDVESKQWTVFNPEQATTRVSPESTYKIYSALFGLNEKIITPLNTNMAWDYTSYPFKEWEQDQTLETAMASSVNWYFQNIDAQLGSASISSYLTKIGYGNTPIIQDIDYFWMESSLKISPIEQVELLTKLVNNDLPFRNEDMNKVKDSIYIMPSENGSMYGKTGTGRVNGNDINGWFIGYIKTNTHTYVFATNIHSRDNATGTIASEITIKLLSTLNIW